MIIVRLYKYLVENKKEFILSKQILRCGTSIGANIEEAIGGYSGKDFVSKMAIAYNEAREAKYWIRLLIDSNYLEKSLTATLLEECDELCRIIGKI